MSPDPLAQQRADVIGLLARRGVDDPSAIWQWAVDSLKRDLNQLLRRRALSLAGLSEPRRPQSNSTTGYRGVSRKRHRFQAKVNGKSIGCFDTPEQAAEAIDAWHRDNPCS